MTTTSERGTIWILSWGSSIDGREQPRVIGYTTEKAVAEEFQRQAQKSPYVNYSVREVSEIMKNELPFYVKA